jgi:hypothetical protein
MAGRPTKYTAALGAEICRRIADGESLRAVCRDENMPDDRTVRAWALEPDHPISPQYARARELQFDRWAEEVVEISDDGSNDWMERELESGRIIEVPDHEHISRSKLRVDTRKWLLSKLLPKRFGDKLEVGGKDGGPVLIRWADDGKSFDPSRDA